MRLREKGGGGGGDRIGGGAVWYRRERSSGGRRDEGIVRRADEGRVGSVTFRIARTRTLCGGCRAREKRILFPLLRELPFASEELITSAISPSLDAAEDHDFRRDPSWRLYTPPALAFVPILLLYPSRATYRTNIPAARIWYCLSFLPAIRCDSSELNRGKWNDIEPHDESDTFEGFWKNVISAERVSIKESLTLSSLWIHE